MKIDQCSTCRADIVWTTSTKGKPFPVDALPDPVAGNVLLTVTPGGKVISRVMSSGQVRAWSGPGEFHLSHFATCPDATLHRRPR